MEWCQVVIRKVWPWTIVVRLCTSFVDVEKDEAYCSRHKKLQIYSLSISPFFVRRLYSFLYIIDLVLVLNIAEILLTEQTAIINQSATRRYMLYECM